MWLCATNHSVTYIPKSVYFLLGWCANSAYSLPSSSLCSCRTRGRRVTIPAFKQYKILVDRLHILFN